VQSALITCPAATSNSSAGRGTLALVAPGVIAAFVETAGEGAVPKLRDDAYDAYDDDGEAAPLW
jgi:hypothetical protein